MLYDAIAASNGFYNSPVDPGAPCSGCRLGYPAPAAPFTCAYATPACSWSLQAVSPSAVLCLLEANANSLVLRCPAPAAVRSLMNVPFTIPSNADLEKEFIAAAAKRGMVSLGKLLLDVLAHQLLPRSAPHEQRGCPVESFQS